MEEALPKSNYFRRIYNPYPLVTSFSGIIKIGLVVGLFVFIFLLAFQPFGLSTFEENKSLIISGYGVITFFTSTIISLFISYYFKELKWTNLHQMVFYLVLLTCLSIANYYYTKIILSQTNLYLFNFLFYTIAVAFFPLTFITFLFQNQQDKKYKLESAKVNHALLKSASQLDALKEELSIKTVNGTPLTIEQKSILFIESEGNYLLIRQLKEGKENVIKYRGTIKTISTKLNFVFQKTHRAFIVNTQYITQAKGNAQGLRLTIKHSGNKVPVSRNFVQHFRRYLEN